MRSYVERRSISFLLPLWKVEGTRVGNLLPFAREACGEGDVLFKHAKESRCSFRQSNTSQIRFVPERGHLSHRSAVWRPAETWQTNCTACGLGLLFMKGFSHISVNRFHPEISRTKLSGTSSVIFVSIQRLVSNRHPLWPCCLLTASFSLLFLTGWHLIPILVSRIREKRSGFGTSTGLYAA